MIEQVAALPYRKAGFGRKAPTILLVTSRQTGRWVVPKGNLMIGKAPHEAAAIEAEEEAGVRGIISPVSLGRFRYRKILAGGAYVMAEVELFPLAVDRGAVVVARAEPARAALVHRRRGRDRGR